MVPVSRKRRNAKVCLLIILSLHCYHLDQSLMTQPIIIWFNTGQSHMTWLIVSIYHHSLKGKKHLNYIWTWSFYRRYVGSLTWVITLVLPYGKGQLVQIHHHSLKGEEHFELRLDLILLRKVRRQSHGSAHLKSHYICLTIWQRHMSTDTSSFFFSKWPHGRMLSLIAWISFPMAWVCGFLDLG